MATSEVEIPSALADLLRIQGIFEHELSAYQQLLKLGVAAPTEIARATGQSRGRIYEILRTLCEKGFALEEAMRPIRFRAVPLADVVKGQLADLESHTKILRQIGEQLHVPAAAEQADVPPLQAAEVAILTGRRSVMEETRRIVRDARFRVLIGGGGRLAERLLNSQSLLQAIHLAQARGVDAMVAVPADADEATGDLRQQLGIDAIRSLPSHASGRLQFVANDEVAVFVFPYPDDDSATRGDDVGIRIPHPFAVESAFQRVAVPVGAGTLTDYSAIQPGIVDAVMGSEREVLAMATREWLQRLQEEGPLRAAFDAAHARGIRLRLITQEDADSQHLLDALAATWDARPRAWVPVNQLILDESHLFQFFAASGSGGPGLVRHSQDPDEVAHALNLFDEASRRGQIPT